MKNLRKVGSGQHPLHLLKARGHTKQAKNMVDDAARELSSVNSDLQQELEASGPAPGIQKALQQSEEVESKVESSSEELTAVNAALAEGIKEREELTAELSKSNDALRESRRQTRRMMSDALHDPLTGLPNFTLFKDHLELAIAQARRHDWRLAVMFINLDEFATVNDSHGPAAGDACLRMIADRLESVTRGEDTVSRRGADEFQFLMVEAKDEPIMASVAKKLARTMGEPCELPNANVTLKASIGIAVFPDDGHSAQELIEKADAAMFAAKHEGGSTVFWKQIDASKTALPPVKASAPQAP